MGQPEKPEKPENRPEELGQPGGRSAGGPRPVVGPDDDPACPECGAPRRADHTPSCGCGPKASDALLEARTAQAAAAEDFNPLRIRPYVALEEGEGQAGPEAVTEAGPGAETDAKPGPRAEAAAEAGPEADGRRKPVQADGRRKPVQAAKAPKAPDAPAPHVPTPAVPAETTMVLRAPDATPADAATTSVLPTPMAPPATAPDTTDLRLFDSAPGEPSGPPRTPAPDPLDAPGDPGVPVPRRRRRAAVVGAAAVAVVVLGTAGYAAGLFSYESPARTDASADGIRAGVPAPETDAPSDEAATDAPSVSSAPASPSPSASSVSETASPSSSASASATGPSASASRTTEPSASATATDSDAPVTESQPAQEESEDEEATGVLRRGDRGPEVGELQQRLRQVHLYLEDIDGEYSRRVEDAVRTFQWARGIRSEELGTYGPLTRAQLERETQEP